MTDSPLALGAIGAVIIGVWLAVRKKSTPLPYPPGPKGLPIIGNALDVNPKEPQSTYAEWGNTYGDIIYSSIFGEDFIIVNSEKTARLLTDKRSVIYSDRPRWAIYKLFGIERMTALVGYGDEWRMHRKLFHLSLGPEVVAKYHPLYMSGAHELLYNLRHNGSDIAKQFKLHFGSLALELAYGRKVEGDSDSIIQMASEIADMLSRGARPENGGLLLAFPILQYFPWWFPGLSFKCAAKLCKEKIMTMSNLMFTEAKRQLESGALPHCLVSDFLTHSRMDESAAKDGAAGVYLAGTETTATTLESLVLALLLYPDVQNRIHAELDAIVGEGNFPTFEDRPRLPYLQAVLYETMRWNPVIPLGVPHATTTNDIYEGYHIPKGSVVILNIWAMAHDCPDPDHFDPTRHLTPDGQLDPNAKQNSAFLFGFGRRVCPGRFFAENALWAAAAVMLSALRFEKAKDVSGNVIDVKAVFTPGVSRHPVPFECSITNRF